jgi:hypothetical protein
MSASLDSASNWNFRVFEKRLIVVKTKNENVRKAAVLDTLTGLMFAVEASSEVSMQDLAVDKEYFADLKIYTSKDSSGADKDFLGFFNDLDVNQNVENFIRAYWVYPGKIRFELTEIEEP